MKTNLFYLIHHVTKVIVCILAVNQNTLKTTAKEKFTNNAIYSVYLYVRDQNFEKYQNLQNYLC